MIRNRRLAALILSLALLPLFPLVGDGSKAYAQVQVNFTTFYNSLSPYGNWVEVERYGPCWRPSRMQQGWQPYYTNGYWAYTDYGWTWVSRWRWGWAPFHYGKWVFHRHHGWVWKPGRVWAPAWVVWRHRPGWIGWAPMPPQVEWRDGIGLRARWDEIDTIVEPHWYSFVEERYFPARDLDRRMEIPARNVTLLRETERATDYAAIENRIINRSVNVERIERAIGEVFDLRPAAIIRDLDLLRPIYAQTAAYGHFGRELPDLNWERTDRAEALAQAAGL